jgi:tetratricopeptide (TPR) repeat protein
MMTNNNSNAKNIHTHDDDDSLSSSEDIGFGAKLSQFSKSLVVVGRRNSLPRELGNSLDADGCFLRQSELSNDSSIMGGYNGSSAYYNDQQYDSNDRINNQVNERYQEQKQGNLYGFIRSVRHTDPYGHSPGVSSHDFDDDGDEDSQFSMSRIGESEEDEENDTTEEGGDNSSSVQNNNNDDDDAGGEGGAQQQPKGTLWHVPKKVEPINTSSHSNSNTSSDKSSNDDGNTNTATNHHVKTTPRSFLFEKLGLGQQDSIRDLDTGKVNKIHHPPTRRYSAPNTNNNNTDNNNHSHGLYDKPNMTERRGANFRRTSTERRNNNFRHGAASFNAGTTRDDTNNNYIGTMGRSLVSGVFSSFTSRNDNNNNSYNNSLNTSSVFSSFTRGGGDNNNNISSITNFTSNNIMDDTNNNTTTIHTGPSSRLQMVKQNVSNAASDTESFRELQKRMKEQGAFTGTAIIALLHQPPSSSSCNNNNNEGGGGGGGKNNHHHEANGGDSVDTGKSVSTGEDSLGMESVRGSMEKMHRQSYLRSSSQDSYVGKAIRRSSSQQSLASSIHSMSLKDLEESGTNNKKSSTGGVIQGAWKEAKNSSWSSLLGGRGAVDTTPSTSITTPPPLTTRLKRHISESLRGDESVRGDESLIGGGGAAAAAAAAESSIVRQQQKEELDARLIKDPIFGGSNENPIPFVAMPSREGIFESLLHAMSSAADQGESCLLTIKGDRFVGKSRLVDEAIDKAQSWGMGFTVLKSHRSETDSLTSFYPFRGIVSTALHDCDAMTMRSDESFDMSGWEKEGEETDAAIVQRLVQRKILNKSDQLMLGRILPDVMNKELLSLLKGRSPTAVTKDIAASIFKLIIPIQPVVMVFEADGNGGDIDLSSWSLIEELLQSAGEQCPQMLMLAMSRKSLSIPKSLEDVSLEVGIERMTKVDTERFVRSLFVNTESDAVMTIDPKIADAIYARAKGCPMFTERAISWARRKRLIDVDEITNFVDWNSPDEDIFPHTLNEEILEVINNLPEDQLDALKIATCFGFMFNLNLYEALKHEGLQKSLEEVIASHGIFDKLEGGTYRWKNIATFEAVESIIISNERREIHERIAASLQHLSNESKGIVLYARHHAMAKQWDQAFDLYMIAGKKAEEEIDFTGAVSLYTKAKPCLSRARNKPSLKRKLSPHAALGSCYRELVRYDEAEEELEFCLEQTMDVPEDERDLAFREIEIDVITTLATLKQAQSKYGEAMDLYERALPTARGTKELQSNTVWLAHHVANCAEIYRKSGDLQKAAALHTEALGYREFVAKENLCSSLELSLSFTQLGTTEAGLGNHSEAYNLHKKALSIRMDQLDFYHSLVSESLNYCADALQALGRGKEGISLAMHAVRIRKHIFGPLHPAYAHALSVLASCYHCIGRSYDSLGLMKECLEICEKFFSESHANLIPNLMLYGSVLCAVGDEKALSVYERALAIHKMNFKGDQNAKQLQKLKDAIEDLSSREPQAPASLDIPIPCVRPESGMVHAIVCADFGRRASDEYMLSVAASLQQMGTLKLISVVAVTPPQVLRADAARGALDSLLLPDVPVAYSRNSPVASGGSNAKTFKSDYGNSSPHVNNTGVELITRAMMAAPDKSLVIMCTGCLGDVSEVLETRRGLFASKVKEVILMGFAAKAVRRRSSIEPEESGTDAEDEVRRKVFQSCQDLGIATVIVCKEIALGFPFPSTFVDDLALSNHMVSLQTQHREEMHSNGIWELTKQLQQEARGYRGSLKNVDLKAFYKYTLGNKTPPAGQHSIWPLVKSINLELVLGLLCCIPMYRDYFKWEVHSRGGVEHKINRHMSASAGVIKPDNLSSEIHMLIGVALRTALNNTSC